MSLILVHGTIASGKSTFLDGLPIKISGHGPLEGTVLKYNTPFDLWRNHFGVNILDLMYYNPAKYMYDFQLVTISHYIKIYTEIMKHAMLHKRSSEVFFYFVEDSHYTSCFIYAYDAFLNGFLSEPEFLILAHLFDLCEHIIKKIKAYVDVRVVHIQAPLDFCYNNKVKRARPEERDLTLTALSRLNHSLLLSNMDTNKVEPVIGIGDYTYIINGSDIDPKDLVEQFFQLCDLFITK